VIAAVALCVVVAVGAAGLAVLVRMRARRASAEAGCDGSTPLAGAGVDLGGAAANGEVPRVTRTQSQRQRDDGATEASRQMRLSTPVTLPPDRAVTTTMTAAAGRVQPRPQGVAIEVSGTGEPLVFGVVPAYPTLASPPGVEAFGFDSTA